MANREWQVERDERRHGERVLTSFCICVKGPRGALHEVLFHTPGASKPSRIERLEAAAIIACAAQDLHSQLARISDALDRGETVTIAPLTAQHIELRRAVIKARGER